MSNILKGLLNEGAYEEGFSDGMNGREDPRASSIYGPDSEKYRSGFSAGLKKREEERQARIQAYQDSIQPYLDIPTDELEQRKQAAIDRSNDIRDIYNKLRGSDYSFDPKRHIPPNNEELSAEFKRLHNEIQAIHQVLYQRQRESMKETKEADYGPNYQAMVKRVGQLAKEGPRKTVWDSVKRVYKTVPVNTPKEVKEEQCPECGGPMFSDLLLAEKKDACYHKVRSRYKVWPSAYASGALVQCRKKGASNWGNKSEGVAEGSEERSQNRLWAMITDYEQRAKATKNDIKKAHYMKMASELRGKLKTNDEQGVAEGSHSSDDWETISNIESKTGKVLGLVLRHLNGTYGFYDVRKGNIESGFSSPQEARQAFVDLHNARRGVAEGLGGQDFEQAHHDEVERYITAYGTPGEYRHNYDAMSNAHNSYLTYPGRTVTINTQQYNGKVGHNVFTKRENVSEGPGFDKWADERAASQLYKLNIPKTWEVSYDYGPHMTKTVTVKAGSEEEARSKVEKAAEKKGMSIMINSVEPGEQGVAEGSMKRIIGYRVVGTDIFIPIKDFEQDGRYYELRGYEFEPVWDGEQGVAEAEKNPHTSALGKALYRDLSKEKKASPQQVQRNKERWAKRQAEREQGVAEGQLDEKCWNTHKQVGMKNKGGKMVPNCVPKESAIMKGIQQ